MNTTERVIIAMIVGALSAGAYVLISESVEKWYQEQKALK